MLEQEDDMGAISLLLRGGEGKKKFRLFSKRFRCKKNKHTPSSTFI